MRSPISRPEGPNPLAWLIVVWPFLTGQIIALPMVYGGFR